MTSLDENITGNLTPSFLRKPVHRPAFRPKQTYQLTLSIMPCSDICTDILMRRADDWILQRANAIGM